MAGLALGLLSSVGGCGAHAPPVEPLIAELPLTDYLPEGSHFAVVAEPARLMDTPAIRAVIDALIAPERFDTFRAHNGIDPRTLQALAYAEYRDRAGQALGTVLAIRGPFHARVAVAEMAHRMIPVESESDAPYYRRGGIYADARRDAIAIDEHTLLLVTGSPVLAAQALQITAPRALEADAGALLGALAAPLVVLWPQPLDLPLGTDLALILARERALAVSFDGGADDRVTLHAEARGEFPPGIEDNLRTLAQSLAVTDMGHRLGMPELALTLEVHESPHGVRASGVLSAATLARGLRALLLAEIPEIVGEADPSIPPNEVGIDSGRAP